MSENQIRCCYVKFPSAAPLESSIKPTKAGKTERCWCWRARKRAECAGVALCQKYRKNEGSRSMWLRWDSFSHNYSFTHSQVKHTHTHSFSTFETHTPESLHFLLSNMILPLLQVSRNVTTLQTFGNTLGFIVRLWTISAFIFIIYWCKCIKSKVQFLFEKNNDFHSDCIIMAMFTSHIPQLWQLIVDRYRLIVKVNKKQTI